jgi:hypothetical protein
LPEPVDIAVVDSVLASLGDAGAGYVKRVREDAERFHAVW